MARRRSPQNKAHKGAPEGDTLTALTEKDAQLRRLLKAEQSEWAGTIGRQDFHRIADRVRAELNGQEEVDMGEPGDE